MRGRFSFSSPIFLIVSFAIVAVLPSCGSDGTSPPTDQVPSAIDVTVEGMKNTPITVTVRGTDLEQVALAFTLVTNPTSGTLSTFVSVDGSTAQITYTPNPGFSGQDQFTYTVTDGTNTSDPGTVTINIVNKVPTASEANVETGEGQELVITLTGEDGDDDPLTFSIVQGPANGTLGPIVQAAVPADAGGQATLNATVTYTPTGTFSGSDSFTYTVNDGTATSAAATVNVTVNGETPQANPLAVTGMKNTPLVITLSGTDPNGDPLTFAIASNPTNGALGAITPLQGGTAAEVTYTPNNGFAGMDSFTYTVNDGENLSSPATVEIGIDNKPPVANAGPDQANVMKGQLITFDGTGSDDPDGDPLTFSWTLSDPGAEDQTELLSDDSVAQPTFTPQASGVWTATLTVSDGMGGQNSDEVQITVVNKIPVANAVNVGTALNTPVVVNLSGDDMDDDPLSFTIVDGPTNGTLGSITQVLSDEAGASATVNALVTYTPNTDFEGADSFTYTVNDGTDTSATATVNITVASGPTAGNIAVTANKDVGIFVLLTGNDPFDAGLIFSISTEPSNGTLGPIRQIDPTTAEVVYTPNPGFEGSDSFGYVVTDGAPGAAATSPEALVEVTVGPAFEAAAILSLSNNDAVGVFNTRTLESIAVIPVGDNPGNLSLAPDERHLYVINRGDGTVSVIRTATRSVVATLAVGNNPIWVDVHPSSAFAYVLNAGSNDISVINVASLSVSRTIPLPPGVMNHINFSPDGSVAYVTNVNGSIFVVSTAGDLGQSLGGVWAGANMFPGFPDVEDELNFSGFPLETFNTVEDLLAMIRSDDDPVILNPDNGDILQEIDTPEGVSSPFGTAANPVGDLWAISYGNRVLRGWHAGQTGPADACVTGSLLNLVSGGGILGEAFWAPLLDGNLISVIDLTNCTVGNSVDLDPIIGSMVSNTPIFVDGFESGDATSWTDQTPIRRGGRR